MERTGCEGSVDDEGGDVNIVVLVEEIVKDDKVEGPGVGSNGEDVKKGVDVGAGFD